MLWQLGVPAAPAALPLSSHLHFSDNPQAVQEQDLCSATALGISVQRFAARSSVSSASRSSLRLEVTGYHCSICLVSKLQSQSVTTANTPPKMFFLGPGSSMACILLSLYPNPTDSNPASYILINPAAQ